MLSGRQATAGEKRIHRLLTSEKWSEELIRIFQWNQAQERYEELKREGEEILVVWDGSEIEKPESQKAEDLCAVRSSKAARRKKSRKGIFNQPGGKPIIVQGYEWTACVVVGEKGKPSLAMMDFWSRRGPDAQTTKEEEEKMLAKVAREWGRNVLHVFDRGYAGGPWLEMMWRRHVDFVIRWKKGHHFFDENGEENSLGQLGKKKRSRDHRMIWDAVKHENRKTGITWMQVRHASYSETLWVVIVRRGGEPWYLVTNRCIETEEQAWKIYKAYCRRWQVETVFRYEKSELAIETIRIWKKEKRNKFFHIISLVHSLLLHLLDDDYRDIITWIFREYCHRTGKKQKEAKVPIYRLRWALSRFFQEIRPVFLFAWNVQPSTAFHQGLNVRSQNSG
ncbi:hypothetical protein KDW_37300 [Dictyobacter vulcani]|uniref:Transposase IS4-like domain-containing protein n=4 Tax=Dictyobacter vulcani TaxID=2607529 RepID=A0A5J4KIJ8_9CHLR|nr:hypothetical protein KDW_37300 [Dictyobacter vulcani]